MLRILMKLKKRKKVGNYKQSCNFLAKFCFKESVKTKKIVGKF